MNKICVLYPLYSIKVPEDFHLELDHERSDLAAMPEDGCIALECITKFSASKRVEPAKDVQYSPLEGIVSLL